MSVIKTVRINNLRRNGGVIWAQEYLDMLTFYRLQLMPAGQEKRCLPIILPMWTRLIIRDRILNLGLTLILPLNRLEDQGQLLHERWIYRYRSLSVAVRRRQVDVRRRVQEYRRCRRLCQLYGCGRYGGQVHPRDRHE